MANRFDNYDNQDNTDAATPAALAPSAPSSANRFDVMEHHVAGNDKYLEDLQRERTARLEQFLGATEEASFTEDSLMAARAVVDGMWLNKAEEAGSWLAATAYKVLNPSHERSITEIRETMLGDLEAESQAFRDRAPMTAIAANIVGGLASPVSLAGGQALQATAALRQGAQASRAAPAILGATDETAAASQALARQMAAGGMQGRQALNPIQSAMLSGKELALQVGARAPVAVQGAVLGGAEGAVFGYEGATAEEKRQNAMWSGALSAAFPLGAGAIGKLWNGVTSNKVAQELGSGEDFVNLMFTESKKGGSGVGDIYRHVIGKTFGAKGMIESQVNSLVSRIPKARQAMMETSQTAKNDAVSRMRNLRAIQSDNVQKATDAANEIKESLMAKATANNRIARDDIANEFATKVDEFTDISKTRKADLESAALLEVDEAVNALNADFRANTLLRALPSEADEAGDLVTTFDPQDALRHLDEMWNQFGFKSAKAADYKVNTESLTRRIEAMANSDMAITSGLARNNSGVNNVLDVVAQTLESKVKNGVIKGTDMIKLRSDIGRFIGDLSEGSSAVRAFGDDVQDLLDATIERQLDDAAREAFKADRGLWKNKLMVQEATTVATGGNRLQQGAYTAEDWITASKSRSKNFAARGMGVMQKEAQEVADISRARDKAIKDHAGKRVQEQAKQNATELRALRAEKAVAKREATEAFEAEKRQISKDFYNSKRDAVAKKNYAIKGEAVRTQWKTQTAALDDEIAALKDREKELMKLTTSQGGRITIFEQAFATGVLGSVVGRLFGRSLDTGATLAAGSLAGNLLKPEMVQRAIAGQTGAQRSLNALGQSVGLAADATARSGAVPSLFGAAFNNVIDRSQ